MYKDIPEKEYTAGWADPEEDIFRTERGLTEKVVREISRIKNEPSWMLDFRLESLKHFTDTPLPRWGDELGQIDFNDLTYYVRYTDHAEKTWDDVPDAIKSTFDRLGVPEAERKFLAGLGAQYDSEVVYHKLREDLEKLGVVFLDTDTGLKEYEDVFLEYFGTVVPKDDNKFASLNSAVWSGGSFILVPRNTKVDVPLQAYFRINAKNVGQFERTLIIAEKGADVHYVEGCTAPIYSTDSLHSAVVELIAMEDARIRYTTIQNWSNNVYNLVTKRGFAYKNAHIEWIDGNLGSKLTMKYPSIYLMGQGARGEVISVAYAGTGQHQDAGAKMIHLAPDTKSRIINKSISRGSGKTTYRGLVRVSPTAKNISSNVVCDALLLNEESTSDTFPYIETNREDATISHEATVGKIGEDQLFYLMSRGINENDALSMIVMGFFEPFVKELPMDYAVELNRLVQLQMEGSVG
ncbi:MAG: Fe-S cluster assembly protein SufB [Candidatus Heimdallarchaeota archaeon]